MELSSGNWKITELRIRGIRIWMMEMGVYKWSGDG